MPLCFNVLAPFFTPARHAGRTGYRLAKIARLRAAKLARLPEMKVAKRSWLELSQERKFRARTSAFKDYPPRLADQPDLPAVSDDDVWLSTDLQTRTYSVAEAVAMHRELMQPSMFNNPSMSVRLKLELNMLGEKAKLVEAQTRMVALPHRFDHGEKRSILMFVQDAALSQRAVEAGARMAGGKELIKKILKGDVRMDAFDFVLCHTETVPELTTIRGVLKDKFPLKKFGSIGDDVDEMVTLFKHGVRVQITRHMQNAEWGIGNAIIARLDMQANEIEANVKSVIASVIQLRPTTPKLLPFINQAWLMLDMPDSEYFAIPFASSQSAKTETPVEKKKRAKVAAVAETA